MIISKTWLYAVVAFLGLALVSNAPAANESIGVVVMHGKWGSPSGWTLNLVKALEHEGVLVANLEMPWSDRRMYDKGVDDAMAEIDAAVQGLQKKGAKKVFVAGHSLGAAAVVRYGTRTTVDGLIVLAPGHFPEGQVFRNKLASSVKKAREMVQAGKGDDKLNFDDLNTGNRAKSVRVAAKVYLDYFDPDGPMNFQNNTASLRPGVPILWVVGTAEEEGPKRLGALALKRIPANPGNKFVEVNSDHLNTPNKSIETVIGWIKEIAG